MLVFHHNDADGRCAAAIVKRYYDQDALLPTCERLHFVELDHSKPVPVEEIWALDTVVIVDFSLQPEIMAQALARTSMGVIWCDHHTSVKDCGYEHLPGYRDLTPKGLAGCECTWRHFFPNEPIPAFVTLLGDYDSWRLEKPHCLAFYEGLKLHDQSPTGVLWGTLLSNPGYEDVIVCEGQTAIKYRDNYCMELRTFYGYETVLDGHAAYALNAFRFGSQAYGELFEKYPICIAYIHNGKTYSVSMYSTMVDVSIIAKKHGGGGHAGAAGFICTELPWSTP